MLYLQYTDVWSRASWFERIIQMYKCFNDDLWFGLWHYLITDNCCWTSINQLDWSCLKNSFAINIFKNKERVHFSAIDGFIKHKTASCGTVHLLLTNRWSVWMLKEDSSGKTLYVLFLRTACLLYFMFMRTKLILNSWPFA